MHWSGKWFMISKLRFDLASKTELAISKRTEFNIIIMEIAWGYQINCHVFITQEGHCLLTCWSHLHHLSHPANPPVIEKESLRHWYRITWQYLMQFSHFGFTCTVIGRWPAREHLLVPDSWTTLFHVLCSGLIYFRHNKRNFELFKQVE